MTLIPGWKRNAREKAKSTVPAASNGRHAIEPISTHGICIKQGSGFYVLCFL
jgi:hypothetical protein